MLISQVSLLLNRTNGKSIRPTSITGIQCSGIYITLPSGRRRRSCNLLVFPNGLFPRTLGWRVYHTVVACRLFHTLYISCISGGTNAVITEFVRRSSFDLIPGGLLHYEVAFMSPMVPLPPPPHANAFPYAPLCDFHVAMLLQTSHFMTS